GAEAAMIVLILMLGALCAMVAVAFEYNVVVGIVFSLFAMAPFVIAGLAALADWSEGREDLNED
ncbi:MAG: hypothetical protein WCI12_11450, partial [Actinomycetes bacterium]